MWQFWKKDPKDKDPINRIMLKDELVFGFEKSNGWTITRLDFEHDGYGNDNQMIIYLRKNNEPRE